MEEQLVDTNWNTEKWSVQSDNGYESKIPYMQTFRFIKITRYHEGTNENSAYGIFYS